MSNNAASEPAFNDGEFWIGRHAADEDLLVFDPAASSPTADPIGFYSLTHHRRRTFPRAVVVRQIHPLADDISRQRARHDYDNRATLRQEHADVAAEAQASEIERRRESVLAAHRRYLAAIGVEYVGASPTPADHRPGRRSKCHVCSIALDDFAGAVCLSCNGVLCSCGGCACVRSVRSPRGDAE